MSRAVAAVGPSSQTTTREASTPIVFIDGVPAPDLSVISATLSAPLDDRKAELVVHSMLDRARLQRGSITVALPHALNDGEVRWQVLLSGRFIDAERAQSSGKHQDTYEVRDQWSAALAETADTIGPWNAGLTLKTLMHRLAAQVVAEVVFACEDELLEAVVTASSPLTQTIGSLLEPVLDRLGLAVEQTLVVEDRHVRRTLTLVPQRSGRRVALPWPDDAGRGGSVVSVRVDRQARPPRRWVARGGRPVVEDTFALQPGWDASLQGQPDSDYGRLTSSDFSRFGSVYRAWVLNEDGFFSGPAFDAGALFDRPGSINQPLRFGSCLTRDPSGRRLTAVIESSTDSGATWSAYPGDAELMDDRAGLLLIDDVLPAAILSAAKAGTLRLRVTASLTSPAAIEATRWDGNPFVGPAPTRVLDLRQTYAWRSVAPTSIHAVALDAGTLTADTTDDRRALRQHLQDHITQQPGPDARATLDLLGAWTALRPGDLVSDALGPGQAIDGNPSSFGTRDARVQHIDLTFGVTNNTPRTRLRLD